MNWSVLKFGGTSVSTRARWDTIAAQAQHEVAEGRRPVIVCSAISGISNALERLLVEAPRGDYDDTLRQIERRHLELARELEIDADALSTEIEELRRIALGMSLTAEVSARLHARTMAFGELMSTRLGSLYLQSRGIRATWKDARKALRADRAVGGNEQRHYLSGTADFAPDPALQSRWGDDQSDVILTQGFIASDDAGHTVLLGRGGSDTSAAYFAAKLQADILEIWTDVPGMYTANPRDVPSARLLKRLGYDEAQEIATMGGKVLHPRCIDPVRRYAIPLQIRCTQAPAIEGTRIGGRLPDFGAQVKAISAKSGVVLIRMDTVGMWQQVGFLSDVFSAFKRCGLSVDLVATSETNVTVSLDPGANALDGRAIDKLLAELRPFCTASQIGPAAAVSIIGRRIRTILHQLGPALEAFEERDIYMVSQAASDLNLTFVVDEAEAEKLVQTLHTLIFHERVGDALLGPTWEETFESEAEAPGVITSWWAQRRDELLDAVADRDCAYVYDRATLQRRAQDALSIGTDRVFYAMKANSNPDVLRLLHSAGIGFECVSVGEIDLVRETLGGLPEGGVLFTPNFAGRDEYASAFEQGVYVTLDNLQPLQSWPDVFGGTSVLVRFDPGRGKGHHRFVKTAGPRSKFGVAPSEMDQLLALADSLDVTIHGLHVHVGSGIRSPQTWAENAAFLAEQAARLGTVAVLNIGGGLGVPEKPGDTALDIDGVRQTLERFRQAHPGIEIWMEPGRFLVAEAGVLLARVTQTKSKGDLRYVGIATGMNSLIRPALYGAYHHIANLSRLDERPSITADVVGPICETGDVLGRGRRLPQTEPGDVIVIATAGAYGRAMSSHYNQREPAPELLI